MKKILTLVAIITLSFCAKAQISGADLQGVWTLTDLAGIDSSLSPDPDAALTQNFLHDFPLTSTTLSFSGADFTMVHHGGEGILNGTFDVGYAAGDYPFLTLHATGGSCAECEPKDLVFVIKSYSASQLDLDKVGEDVGTPVFPRLTLTK